MTPDLEKDCNKVKKLNKKKYNFKKWSQSTINKSTSEFSN